MEKPVYKNKYDLQKKKVLVRCVRAGRGLSEEVAGGCQEHSASCGVETNPSDAEGYSRTEDAATCQSSCTSTGGKVGTLYYSYQLLHCGSICSFDFD